MGLLKKHAFLIISVLLVIGYFITRLTNLSGVPIFTDEAIYLRWAQIASNDPHWLFISLTDGKQPLFIWFTIVSMKLISDPLIAGRMVSVFAGLASAVGLFFLTKELFRKKRIALLAVFLYIIFPFAVVYDRMALYDSLVATGIIWSIYLEIVLVRTLQVRYAFLLGIVIGFSLLNKSSAEFSLILLPLSLLFFNFKTKQRKDHLVKWAVFVVLAGLLSEFMYAFLRLSPFYYIIKQKDATFIYPFSEWIHHPLSFILPNLSTLTGWLIGYSMVHFLVFVLASFFFDKKTLREKIFLFGWFLIPFLALATFGKLLYPRYILFMTMPLLVLGAYSFYTILHGLPKRWLKAGVLTVLLLPFVINTMFVITNFDKAWIPLSDKNQYYRGWPSGGGIQETIAILEKASQHKKIYVGTEGTFGLLPYALEIYQHDNPNMIIQGFYPIHDTPPQALLAASKTMPTYMIFYQQHPGSGIKGLAPASWHVKMIYQYKKLEADTYNTLYQIEPK